jgi:C-terminal processing protease CtpA/Prc
MNPTGTHGDSAADTNLGTTITLQEFRATTSELTTEERERIVDQALVLIEQFYVHLPLKRAMHAVDPVQRLKLLRYRLRTLSERRFHDEMISIFMELRDLHTNYLLPAPFAFMTASLPLQIGEFFADGDRQYLVTEVISGRIDDPQFEPGVMITHWNGVPMDRAVELNADRQAGSNPDARHAQGLDTMTARYMGLSAAPDEDWVVLNYVTPGGQEDQAKVRWLVAEPDLSPTAVDPNSAENPLSQALGIDVQTENIRRARKMLFRPDAMDLERQVTATFEARGGLEPGEAVPDPALADVSTFPDKLQFRTVSTPHGEFGYIRIRSFAVGSTGIGEVDAFVAEIVRIARQLPQNGLIVDVRGNGGGTIMAGERLLQVFTPNKIEPERLHFINTPLTLELAGRPGLDLWSDSIAQAVETGSPFSDGFPILPDEPDNCNRLGQQYYGPVVLVIDGLCYSTTDIFAAGWQDHRIGPILGTDGNSGAGGANVWTHVQLSGVLSGQETPLQPLPKRTRMRVALRRTSRVGGRSGDPLEDLGVVPDEIHHITRNDLLNDAEDLIERAASILAGRLPVRSLAVEVTTLGDPTRAKVSADTQNITRLDAYVDGRPRMTLDVQDGSTTFDLPLDPPGAHELELRGFDGNELVALRRIEL